MTRPPTVETQTRLTPVQWVICSAAAGFAFDSYVLLMLPLIIRPALLELAHVKPGCRSLTPVGMLFDIPAIAGGTNVGRISHRSAGPSPISWSILLLCPLDSGIRLHQLQRPGCWCWLHNFIESVLSLLRLWPGWLSYFPIRSSVRRCWDIRRRFPRWAASWQQLLTTWP